MADLKEKLVEILDESFEHQYDKNLVITARNTANALIANGVTIQLWIPVTERLPEEFVSVLVYAPGIAPLPTVFEAYFARGCWVTRAMVMQGHEVTHWMEMPAGPEEVSYC